jgi:hypothetical protein
MGRYMLVPLVFLEGKGVHHGRVARQFIPTKGSIVPTSHSATKGGKECETR